MKELIREYAWIRHYLRCALRSAVVGPRTSGHKLVFVVPEASKGWILDAICRELNDPFPGESEVFYHDGQSSLPPAAGYFFCHQSQLFGALARHPEVWSAKRFVWYTHNSDEDLGARPKEIPWVLNRMDRVFLTNSALIEPLTEQGVRREVLQPLFGGADPDLFKSHRRTGATVGLSMAYYERKNPELMAAVAEAMPDVNFELVGPGWDAWPGFEKFRNLANVSTRECKYPEYPGVYANWDVYLSTSDLEGGPIPLVETMMCNIVPVVSDTGFSRDLVTHGENGYVFPVRAPAAEVVELIRQALASEADVAATAEHLTWAAMSRNLAREASL